MKRRLGLVLLALLAWALPGVAQEPATPYVEWMTDLQALEAGLRALLSDDAASLERLREQATTLRHRIQQWLARNPQARLSAARPSQPAPLSRESLMVEARELRRLIEEVIRLSPAGPFNLGRVEIEVTAEAPKVPNAYVITGSEIEARNAATVTAALSLAPGVTVSRVGARNEGVIYLRGFDMRQTPVYFDGMPVSIPFDGYADLDRFLAQDLAEVHVAKGFSSTLYGPNTLGGAVNLVSRVPAERFHGELGAGYESGRAFSGQASLGARTKKLYLQGSSAWLERDFFPLAAGFPASPLQPTRHRLNSDRRDSRGHFKAGLMPGAGEEYAFGYLKQDARKGQPPYAGADSSVRPRYWRWPDWGKDSLYHIANKTLGRAASLRLRAYYDTYRNRLDSFDDATYSTRLRSSSFISLNEDHSWGGRLEFGARSAARHAFRTALSLKDDTHREHNLGEPQRSFRSRTLSAGVEDSLRFRESTQALVGFGADHMDVLQAQNFQNGVISPFPTGSVWAFNPQAGVLHALSPVDRLRFSFARKTRLPTLKDRYSYRIGRSVPNPDLKQERADHWEAGYLRTIGAGTLLDVAAFRSTISGLLQEFYVGAQVFQFRNLGRVEHSGFEVTARTDRLRRATLQAGCTYLNRKNVSQPSVPLVQTPRHDLFVIVSAPLRGGAVLLGDARFETGRWDLNEAGRYVKLGGFAVVNANAIIPLGHRLELHAGARNLTDRNYFLDEGFPEEGRNFYLHLRYRF